MSDTIGPVDPLQFNECLEMAQAVAAVQQAGASPEAAMAVHDLVKTGAYHMSDRVAEAGYAIFRLSPLIVRDGLISVEPVEFGAGHIVPQWAEWSRQAETAMVGDPKNGAIRRAIGKQSLSSVVSMSAYIGGNSLSTIAELAEDIPSKMLGGQVVGVQFHPLLEDGSIAISAIPFWHRSLALALSEINPDQFGSGKHLASRLLRKLADNANQASLGNEETRATMALIALYHKATPQPAVAIDGQVNLMLPPKRFLS